MKNNILLFHIGTPKTGSTALQIFLSNNRLLLEKHGWTYPDLANEAYGDENGKIINGEVFLSRKRSLENMPPLVLRYLAEEDDLQDIWGSISKHLEHHNVIVSCESLWRRIEPLTNFICDKYDNIKFIVYLRRQDRLVESFWNQEIKSTTLYNSNTLDEYVTKPSSFKILDYLSRLRTLTEAVGKENIIVKVYEKQRFANKGNNAIALDFLETLGIPAGSEEWVDAPAANPGLSKDYLEVKRIFNSIVSAGYIDDQDDGSTGKYASTFVKLSETFDPGGPA